MLDIPSISAIVAAVGVIIGVVFAVLQLRDIKQTRQADLAMRVHSTWISEGMMKTWARVMNLEFKDYTDFKKKFGSFLSESPEQVAFNTVANHFETMGYLLSRKMIDFGLVDLTPVSITWQKMQPIIDGNREQYNAKVFEWFEHLYNETKKRSQKLLVQQ